MNRQIIPSAQPDPCRPAGGLPALQVTLQLAVHHHNFGQLHEAARLYCEVLHSQPTHAPASHNLGLLMLQLGLPEAGLAHLEAALAQKPDSQRYWLSYIDALDQLGQTALAQRMLAVGQSHGLDGDEIEALADLLAARRPVGRTCSSCSVRRRQLANRRPMWRQPSTGRHGQLLN
ncbi:MAG: tetratricopeptide repeat protein [Comamonadaceae bacterium]